jgi:hypothetical protein
MSDLIVGPLQESDLRIDPEGLAKEVLSAWPDARLSYSAGPDDPALLRWTMQLNGWSIYCALHRTGQSLGMEGGQAGEWARVALWFRRLVPAEHRLALYDPGFNGVMELERGTTREDIIHTFG